MNGMHYRRQRAAVMSYPPLLEILLDELYSLLIFQLQSCGRQRGVAREKVAKVFPG